MGKAKTFVVTLVVAMLPATATAHTALIDPPARYSRDFQKDGPCGQASNPPGEVMTTYPPGATIELTWQEFVPHPGHFRISLSAQGDGEFVDPTDYDDFYPADNVLADEIEDPDGVAFHTFELTLPDIECNPCVLQLLQIMTDKPPWGPEGGNEIYYQCADIALVAGAPLPGEDETGVSTSGPSTTSTSGLGSTGDEPSTGAASESGTPGQEDPDESDGCACQSSAGSSTAWGVAALALVAFVRRRRPR